MSSDFTSLENELRNLRATDPDPELADRLDRCTEGSWARLSPAETRLEESLRKTRPAPLSNDLRGRLESVVAKVPFPAEGNVTRFPARRRSFPWSAAAAVAICGALAALLVPLHDDGAGRPGTTAEAVPQPSAGRSSEAAVADQVIPADFSRNLNEARVEGVVWGNPEQPHRLLRMEYSDNIRFKDSEGRVYQIEKPGVGYMLVPAETD